MIIAINLTMKYLHLTYFFSLRIPILEVYMNPFKGLSLIMISFLAFFVFSTQSLAVSYYYYEDFSGGYTSEWIPLLAYGRSGTITPTAAGGTFPTHNIVGQEVQLRGTPNDGLGSRNGYWMGRYVYNTNRYDATASAPFGF